MSKETQIAQPNTPKTGWDVTAQCKQCGKTVRLAGIQQHWKRNCPGVTQLGDHERRCSLCQIVKQMSFFRDRLNVRHGGSPRFCRECQSQRLSDWRRKIGRSQLVSNDSPRVKRAKKNRALKWYHGITIEDFDRMLAAQDGKCPICRKPPTGMNRR